MSLPWLDLLQQLSPWPHRFADPVERRSTCRTEIRSPCSLESERKLL